MGRRLGETWFRPLRIVLVTVMLTAIAAGACSGADVGPEAKSPTPQASGQPSSSGKTGNGDGGNGSTSGGGDKSAPWLIRWITDLGPGGPAGGPDDPAWDAYRSLQHRDCAASINLADNMDNELDRQVYSGAGNACLAILRGESARWAAADAAFASAEQQIASASDVTCYDRGVYEFLQVVVGHHRTDPSRQFEFRQGGMATTCLRFIRLEPAHGPVTGGFEVTVYGENMPQDTTLEIYGSALDHSVDVTRVDVNGAGTRLTFVMPPADRPGEVSVDVRQGSNRGEAFLDFTYQAAPDTSPSSGG